MDPSNEGGVTTKVKYLKPEKKTPLDATGRGTPGLVSYVRPGDTVTETLKVLDARALTARGVEFSLERNGFVLVPHKTRCPDFRDKAAVRQIYYPEVTEVVRRVTGAAHAVVADHTLRTDGYAGTAANGKQTPLEQARNNYADLCHLDSNKGQARDGPRRFASRVARERREGFGTYGHDASVLLPQIERPEVADGVDTLDAADYDYVTYNVWQPFDREVQQNPLAVLDARTLDQQNDLAPLITAASEKFGGSTALMANPRHQWYYYSKMQTDELLLFVGHLHPLDQGVNFPGSNLLSAHTSFIDPTAPKDALGRRSIEIRVIAAFPKKGKLEKSPAARL